MNHDFKSTWTASSTYINIETGEIIKKTDIDNFTIVKKNKHVRKSKYSSGGTIEYTYECRPNKWRKQKFPFSDI